MSTRVCETKGCGTILSRYNGETTCNACRAAAVDRLVKRTTANQDRVLRILANVQATAPEVATAVGCTELHARRMIFDLIEAGRVQRGPKDGATGLRRYMLADDTEAAA
ncbi:hypothetical protein [Miltoncostaea oceani]|uniref:hypothetical protein n=1 Tax=Miltoncostaea oceani TaxID=2843216 RepID=UPI001C3C8334|nr:hypothetical protein [Miltoncostaea oceani]